MIGFGTSPLELMACEAFLAGLVYLDEFSYSVTFLTGTSTELDSNGSATGSILINDDSDFISAEYNLVGAQDGAIVDSPNLLITMIRSGSGRELMSDPQHIGNFCGSYLATSSFPGRKPITELFQGNMRLNVKLQDLSGANWDRIDFAMRGFKVFYQTNDKGQTGNRQKIFHAL